MSSDDKPAQNSSSTDQLAATAELPQPMSDFLVSYENQLGVPNGFVRKLLAEPDDWSFVLKLHGLLEGALSKKLLELIGKPALAKPFQYVQMRTLISMGESLEAISKRAVTFLKALSELRNALVHTVANVGFEFERWAAQDDSASLRSRLLGPDGKDGLAAAPPFSPYRFVIWGHALIVMAELQAATVAQAEAVSHMIDNEVERRSQIKAKAERKAVLERLGELLRSTDPE